MKCEKIDSFFAIIIMIDDVDILAKIGLVEKFEFNDKHVVYF